MLAKKKKFSVIAVSETCLNDQKVELDGYEMYTAHRTSTTGGGVALYVDCDLRCSTVQRMTTVLDDIFECLTVEIVLDKTKNIVVSCIYRTPGSCLETFNNNLDNIFNM